MGVPMPEIAAVGRTVTELARPVQLQRVVRRNNYSRSRRVIQMMSREYSTNNTTSPTKLSDMFTPDELSRLDALRQNFYTHAEYLERVIDDRRLEFARWLLDHGKLSEGANEI
jgi:hypothetical protein